MGSLSKYRTLDHSAPEVVEQQDAPEVVPESYPQPVKRQSSHLQPEPFLAAPYYKQDYAFSHSDSESTVPKYDVSSTPSYVGLEPAEDVREKEKGRRYCGMRKTVLIIAIAVALLICIAIVLGAVLGTVLSNQSTDRIQAISMTGLATTVSGNTLYQYFQNPDGKILENSYVDGAWTLKEGSNIDGALVTGDAGAGSPISAIAYPYKGDEYRQVFYVTSTGQIKTVNRTETRTWGASTTITHDKASSGSIGLAACWSNKIMNGIRVFYASQYGYIQEVARDFDGSKWSMFHQFDGSDASSGVGCTIKNGPTDQFLNVYVRHKTSSRVVQNWFNFADGVGWATGPVSWSNQTIPQGSDIATCNDGVSTEYVFYQLAGGLVTRGVMNPGGTIYETFKSFQGASIGSKLATSWFKDGATLVFQNRSSSSAMWASDVSRDNVPIFNLAVT